MNKNFNSGTNSRIEIAETATLNTMNFEVNNYGILAVLNPSGFVKSALHNILYKTSNSSLLSGRKKEAKLIENNRYGIRDLQNAACRIVYISWIFYLLSLISIISVCSIANILAH